MYTFMKDILILSTYFYPHNNYYYFQIFESRTLANVKKSRDK